MLGTICYFRLPGTHWERNHCLAWSLAPFLRPNPSPPIVLSPLLRVQDAPASTTAKRMGKGPGETDEATPEGRFFSSRKRPQTVGSISVVQGTGHRTQASEADRSRLKSQHLPLMSCVSLGKPLAISEHQFPPQFEQR